MSFPAKIVYPAPPPTTNVFTAEQRTQLMRKAKKLEQILGTTPQIIDESTYDPIEVDPSLRTCSRASMDSFSSSSMYMSPTSSRAASPFSDATSISRSGSLRSSRSSSWPKKLSFLHLSDSSSSLESIPASPLFDDHLTSSSSLVDENTYLIKPNPTPIDASPSFTIATSSSLRLQKMDRLRRKLGPGIPLHLVFPEAKDVKVPSTESAAVKKQDSKSETPAQPRATKRTGRIAHTRDSLAGPSPHHAKRQLAPSPSDLQSLPQRFRDAQANSSTHLSEKITSRRSSIYVPVSVQTRKSLEHPYIACASLCVIIESPDEHGAGCAEEFGFIDSKDMKLGRHSAAGGENRIGGKARKPWSYRKPPPPLASALINFEC